MLSLLLWVLQCEVKLVLAQIQNSLSKEKNISLVILSTVWASLSFCVYVAAVSW